MAKEKRDMAATVAAALAETAPPVVAPVAQAPSAPPLAERDLTQLTVQLDRQLARDLKAAAAQDGETLRAVMTAAAREWLARRAVAGR